MPGYLPTLSLASLRAAIKSIVSFLFLFLVFCMHRKSSVF